MELVVEDVLALPEFTDVQLIAGRVGFSRTVTGVNIIEVPTVTHWMRGGEILFSSGYAFGGDDKTGCKLLEDLHDHEIAALVLKPGEYLESVSDAMKGRAEELGFPLLTMPGERPYSYYMDAVYTLLLNQKAKTLEASSTICNHLFNIAIDNSYEPLSQFVSESLKRPVYFLDNEGNPLHSDGENEQTIKYIQAFSSITQHSLGQDGLVNEFVYDIEGVATSFLYIPIESVQRRVRYLVSVDCEYSDRELCCSVLPFVARIIQIQEMHKYSMLRHENKIAGDLLGDIIEGRFEDPGIIYQRGKLLHIDLTRDLIALVVSFNTDNMDELNCVVRSEHEDYLLRSLVREAVLTVEPHVLFLDRKDSVVCLLQVVSPNPINVREKIESLAYQDDFLKKYSLNIGVSRQANGISVTPALCRQAEIASKVARARHDSNDPISFYEDLGLFRLYPELVKSYELRSLMEDILRPVLVYDQENGTEYLRVLRTFYENDGVISRSADALFIHKNTMIKYLNKLEEITKRDLRNYNAVAEVMFCLRYLDLLHEQS